MDDSLQCGTALSVSGVSERRVRIREDRIVGKNSISIPTDAWPRKLCATADVRHTQQGQMVIVAAEDSSCGAFRFGAVRVTVPWRHGIDDVSAGKRMTIEARMVANNEALERMEDGTDVDWGTITRRGISKPTLRRPFVPPANMWPTPGCPRCEPVQCAGSRLLGEPKCRGAVWCRPHCAPRPSEHRRRRSIGRGYGCVLPNCVR